MTNSAKAAANKPLIDSADLQAQVNGLYDASRVWLATHWLNILIALAVGTVIVVVLHAARNLGARLARRSKTGKGWPAIFGRTIQRTGNFFIVMLAAQLVAGYAGAPGEVATTITFLFTIAAVFQAAVWIRELILGAIEHRTRTENYSGEALLNAMGLIRLFVTLIVFSIALIVVLDNLGVNVTGLVAGLGVGGIAIGLAAQGIFADLFAALAIIFDRPFRRGDAITFDKSSGTVEEIGLKSTRIRAPTGEERIISNKNLLNKEIINNTRREYRRITFTLGVVQWTPVEVMAKLPGMMKELIEDCNLKYVRAGFTSFGDSSYDFDVEFDSLSAAFQDAYDARHRVGLAIIRRLNDEGIELAYPTQTGFTAAPDGHMVLPYPGDDARVARPDAGPSLMPSAPPSSGDRTAVDQD